MGRLNKAEVNQACNARKCKTCIFQDRQDIVSPARLAEIQNYLIHGQQHECHVTKLICRGGRDFQKQIYYRLGLIPAETDEALLTAAQAAINNDRRFKP